MKLQKSKIVFATITVLVLLFIIAYSMMVFQEKETSNIDGGKIPLPELLETQEVYKSKLDAINSLKEVRQTNAPSIYDESLLDSSGNYDPKSLDKEKQRIVDSIYNKGRINYSKSTYRRNVSIRSVQKKEPLNKMPNHDKEKIIKSHQDFFQTYPKHSPKQDLNGFTDKEIHVVVNGDQKVKAFSRLELRTTHESVIDNQVIPKNTYLYGFVSFKPNRTLIHITNIHHKKVSLKAFDLQDGNEGIYVVNNFKTDLSKSIIDDMVGDVNIPGVPSLDVIKNVFQKSNRNLKVTITNNYKLILKPTP